MENHHFLMEKSTISMAIFHCYVSPPEGKYHRTNILAFLASIFAARRFDGTRWDTRWDNQSWLVENWKAKGTSMANSRDQSTVFVGTY